MSQESMTRTVLCYGDSNTWGYRPVSGQRYAPDVRWSGVLRNSLGDKFWVIEEGLNGRTTVWDDPIERYKSGAEYLPPCLHTHKPIDIVILMLGTNDLKKRFSLSAFDVAAGMERLLKIIEQSGSGHNGAPPRVLVISPPHVGQMKAPLDEMFEGAAEKSRALSRYYKLFAKMHDCEFMDAAEIVTVSDKDGLHLDEEGHQKLGKAVAEKVLSLWD